MKSEIILDSRDASRIVAELMAKRPAYVQEWLPSEKGPDFAILQIVARYLQIIIQRLNQSPDKNQLAFLDMLGIKLTPAQSARAPVVFELIDQATDTRVAVGTRLSAQPPPESNTQVFFETERTTGIMTAKLREVISILPGRDQYINHSSAFLAGQPFQPFLKSQLQYTPHEIYIAHNILLALAGKTILDVKIEMAQFSDEPLDTIWEYWDGKIWRKFRDIDQPKLDNTNGFMRNGTIRLETDCAETSKTSVNGIEAYWIRGRLAEPLLPDLGKALPNIESIKLSSEISRPLNISLSTMLHRLIRTGEDFVIVKVQDESGITIKDADVTFLISKPSNDQIQTKTNINGISSLSRQSAGTITVVFEKCRKTESYDVTNDTKTMQELTFTLKVMGLKPDKAFSDGNNLDITKAFYPFGQHVQPGSSFYFTNEEILSKPGAKLQIFIKRTATSQDQSSIMVGNSLSKAISHTVNWEYWNGRNWSSIMNCTNRLGNINPGGFDDTGIVELIVPEDIVRTKVNDQEGLWMRARLVSGGYGFMQAVSWYDESSKKTNSFSYFIPQPPALADFCMGYSWQNGPFYPEQVFTYNDFQYEDNTEPARWSGKTFLPFKPVSDVTPSLYMGFDKKLPVDHLSLYLDIVEEIGKTKGPALIWEYWNGSAWQELSVEDETNNLRIPGMLHFIPANDNQSFPRFETELYWLRGRLKEDMSPGEPLFRGIFTNVIWANQQQTIIDEVLGASTGQPNQVFKFRQIPVLEGAYIEVQELVGPRANVEWRILADEISGGDKGYIMDLEDMLSHEESLEIAKGDLRLRRNTKKQVSEVWVRWHEKGHLFFSKNKDRHYMIDRSQGILFFGMQNSKDEINGKIPPQGSVILARQYRSGGGAMGNVPAFAINQVIGSVSGVQKIFNPIAGEGGANGETLDWLSIRGPKTIRHRGRTIGIHDYETLAREASPAIAVAKAIPACNSSGISLPGWITLIIIPQSNEARPFPSYELREKVRKFIEKRAPTDVTTMGHIYITGPEYQPIDVSATIIPKNSDEAGIIEQLAKKALEGFFHPISGGPEKHGWEPGRGVFLSDVASVLKRIEGVDYVSEIKLLLDGTICGDHAKIAINKVIVSGNIRLKITKI